TAHTVASSSKDVTIVALKRERDDLQAELNAAQDREAILRTRMANVRLTSPESLLDFLDTHTIFDTNWERLQGVLKHYCDGTTPPAAWRTRVDVVALELGHYQQRPYQNAASRAASVSTAAAAARDLSDSEEKESPGGSILPTASTPGARSGTNVARNLSSTSFAVSGVSDSEGAAGAVHTVDLTSAAPTVGSAGASSAPTLPVAVQHYPSSHIGGTRGTRPSRELHSVSLSKAKELLPVGVSWDDVRLDVRELIQFGASFDEAVARVQEDKTLHDEFRRRDLIHMLESMAYWGRMNSTLWVKRVTTYYLDQAVENLSKVGAPVPPYWISVPASPPASPLQSASPPKSPVPSGVISAASVGVAGVWDDDFSSLSSLGDSEDEDFAPKPQSQRKRGASAVSSVPARASTKAKSSPPQKRSPLAQKQYSDLTFAELDVIEKPSASQASWRHYGIRVQHQVIPTGRSPQNVGFPSYMPVKTHSKELKQRWDLGEYLALVRQRPWDTMFFQREKRLYFHHHSDLAPELQRQLRKYVDFMSMEAQSFWEVQHWVTIDTGKDADSARLYRELKERRD
ncbi:hypothetical protein BBJ28_00019896, partial [Nothophytophthora sp. Chile5]